MTANLDIEREIFIAAEPATVFEFFIDPARMAQWIGIGHLLDPRPGGVFRVEVSSGHIASGRYVEVTPHSRVVFTWGWENSTELPPGQSLVEFDLVAADGGTLVRLHHTGLPASMLGERHADRWAHFLAQLANVAGQDAITT